MEQTTEVSPMDFINWNLPKHMTLEDAMALTIGEGAKIVTPRRTRETLGDYAYSVVIRRSMMGPVAPKRHSHGFSL